MANDTIDRDYLCRRETQERAAANTAWLPAARDAHLALADRYAALLDRVSEPA